MKGGIRCLIRRKWVEENPEEIVRQSLLHFLLISKKYPRGSFSVESLVKVNGHPRRSDIIVHGAYGKALVLVECKAPGVLLDETTMAQVALYNRTLNAPYLLLSNGEEHYMFRLDRVSKTLIPLNEIPTYEALIQE